jgi:segregation and condensation protein A
MSGTENVGAPTGMHTALAGYRLALDVFEGPLDLLLHLIERQELDITAISLVQVTDQYMAYVQQLEHVDAETLADFLVIAARLLLIKSRALLPRPPAIIGEEEEDAGEALARQLREYKRFKLVAQGLSAREAAGLMSFVRLAPPPRLQSHIDLEGVTLDALLQAVRAALMVTPPAPPVNDVVRPFTITVAQRARAIMERAQAGQVFTFRSLLAEAPSRLEIVVTLLALLELLKRRRVRVSQPELFGEIVIEAAPPGEADEAPTSDEDWLAEEGEPADQPANG